jgi:hypothetical protein
MRIRICTGDQKKQFVLKYVHFFTLRQVQTDAAHRQIRTSIPSLCATWFPRKRAVQTGERVAMRNRHECDQLDGTGISTTPITALSTRRVSCHNIVISPSTHTVVFVILTIADIRVLMVCFAKLSTQRNDHRNPSMDEHSRA